MDFLPPQAKVTANNDKNRTFSVWYVPEVTGTHKVSIQLAGKLVVMGSG
jgi:filamin